MQKKAWRGDYIFITILSLCEEICNVSRSILLSKVMILIPHNIVMEMWWKCDELDLVLIFWLTSFENSRLAKNLMFIHNDNEQWAIYSQLMKWNEFHAGHAGIIFFRLSTLHHLQGRQMQQLYEACKHKIRLNVKVLVAASWHVKFSLPSSNDDWNDSDQGEV